MFSTRAVCCTVIYLVLNLNNCECLQLEYNDFMDNVLIKEDFNVPGSDDGAVRLEDSDARIHVSFVENPNDDIIRDAYKVDTNLVGNDIEEALVEENEMAEEETLKRMVRQAYQSQSSLYPNLPANSPYYQPVPNSNYNNPYQQQPPTNNNYNPGYSNYNTNPNYSSGTQQNSSYGHGQTNYNQPQYPYNNNNNFTPTPHNGQYPNNYNSSTGFKPSDFDRASSRPPYQRPGQFNNNSFSGYPHTPSYGHPNSTHNFNPTPFNPTYRPQYSNTNHSNLHPVGYGNFSQPGYNSASSNQWKQNQTNFNNPSGRPPYAYQNNTNPNNFNSQHNSNIPSSRPPYNAPNNQFPSSNPYSTPYPYNRTPQNNTNYQQWHQNNTNPTPYKPPTGQNYYPTPSPYNNGFNQRPYQNPSNGNNYPGYSQGPDTFNSPNGYNPTIPDKPPLAPFGNNPNPNNQPNHHDPTRVSPEYYSYPH